ncbi:MAG: hypothetical protein OEV79_04450 [candidate division WOR-3 bacterium]|nr:hypothetical protein [candidate division WOR-3 bacterium]
MILVVLLLATYDSLPPLPDLSKSDFPEPQLLSVQTSDTLRFNGYAGHFFGAGVDLCLWNLSLDAAYSRTNEWDTADIGSASLSYAMFGPTIWLKPRLRADLVTRDEEYKNISPGFEFNLFSRSLVTSGALDYNHWELNNETVREASGRILFTFDRLSYIPQFEMTGVYTGQRIKPSLYTQVNVGNFHLKLGSLVNRSFPSPRLSITYATPYLNISTGFNSGVQHSTLISLFDPHLPVRYPTSLPAETLSLAADIILEIKFLNHHFSLSGSYKEWLCRLDIGSDYLISQTLDVQESNLSLSARNVIPLRLIQFSNWLHIAYNTSDSALAFSPDYSVTDTLTITIGIIELSVDARFISERSGLEKSLPAYSTVNTTFGLKLSFAKFYAAINNVTDNTSEIYDNYFMTGRQYAGGIEINRRL